MENLGAAPVRRSVTFRALKYVLIAVLSLIILLIIIGFIGFIGFSEEKTDGSVIAFFIIDSLIGIVAAIVGLIAALKEKYVATIVSGVILTILALVNFVLGVHWLDSSLYLIGGIIAICFAVVIKREVRGADIMA